MARTINWDLLDRAARLRVHPSQLLPEGTQCRDCVWFRRCWAQFSQPAEAEACRVAPSRFDRVNANARMADRRYRVEVQAVESGEDAGG